MQKQVASDMLIVEMYPEMPLMSITTKRQHSRPVLSSLAGPDETQILQLEEKQRTLLPTGIVRSDRL
jgi:hypothetical protein